MDFFQISPLSFKSMSGLGNDGQFPNTCRGGGKGGINLLIELNEKITRD